MFYVYILISIKDYNLYTGFTRDLKKRFDYHNNGLNKSTESRRPFKLLYYEAYANEGDARKRELFLKTGRGREFLNIQLEETLKAYRS